MADNQQLKNLQSAQVIAKIFDISAAEVESLRKKKIITGTGSPKQYDLLPTIMAYIKYLRDSKRYKSAAELAEVFGLSTRRIEQFKTDGIIKGEGKPTKYDYDAAVKDYTAFLSDKAYGREKKEADAQLETEKLSAEKRIKAAKAEMAELELRELKGELHRASDVEAITTDHVMFVRSMLMALPGKLAVDLATIQTASEAAERIKQEVYAILQRLSDYKYDPEEYKRRVRERQGWNERHGDESEEY